MHTSRRLTVRRPDSASLFPKHFGTRSRTGKQSSCRILWQIAGLALLYAVGSPQSREGDERKEKKLDLILKAVDPDNAEKEIEKLDRDYARR
jgi:hypothetical protein